MANLKSDALASGVLDLSGAEEAVAGAGGD
jgi:hypothetical protein